MMQEAQRSSTSVPAGLDVNLIEGGGAFGTFPVSLDQNRYTNLSAAAGDTAHRSLEHIAFSGLDGRAIRNPPTVKSEDEPITPEAEDLLVLHGSATSYAYEPPRHGLVHSAYTYDDVTDPDEVPESLHLLSEYPNSTCAWTNSDMGSSEINF
ncbi:hypothetical protein UCRPA7_8619 [Phaeoacremonium minimum UCRPA7]|uniref:Uncharacterized protein n=1 Tax=Phaeoacremonium minimum (strain UCR-PA7) TaxID=1286976 RepID=R8B984_PHAM7|nr:hypothetical protein UCRPA7_8619 [Phaeoacremonium minimum UCRPA7]EON95859.1 hypothetical protein UCRPA7_8619 [Phaeoacremonium minimum UCRPA7]